MLLQNFGHFCWTGILISCAIASMLASRQAPVIDSILSQHLGTLWVSRFLVIFAGAFFVPFFLFFLQTCRKNVGDGLIIRSELNRSPPSYVNERRLRRPALLPILRTDMSCQTTSVYDSRATPHPQNYLYQDSWPHHKYNRSCVLLLVQGFSIATLIVCQASCAHRLANGLDSLAAWCWRSFICFHYGNAYRSKLSVSRKTAWNAG
jgi:hypothetical protein